MGERFVLTILVQYPFARQPVDACTVVLKSVSQYSTLRKTCHGSYTGRALSTGTDAVALLSSTQCICPDWIDNSLAPRSRKEERGRETERRQRNAAEGKYDLYANWFLGPWLALTYVLIILFLLLQEAVCFNWGKHFCSQNQTHCFTVVEDGIYLLIPLRYYIDNVGLRCSFIAFSQTATFDEVPAPETVCCVNCVGNWCRLNAVLNAVHQFFYIADSFYNWVQHFFEAIYVVFPLLFPFYCTSITSLKTIQTWFLRMGFCAFQRDVDHQFDCIILYLQ